MSLSREQRLRKSADYQRLRQSGDWIPGKYFHLQVSVREDKNLPSRLGLAVSRKTGSAVVRNRIRRSVREWFRVNSSKFIEPIDVVLVAKKGMDALDFQDLGLRLNRSLSKWISPS